MVKMFLDDERFPPGNADDWVIVRSSSEAIEWVRAHGIPNHISFDHDLGGDDTAMVFLHQLAHMLIDSIVVMPEVFSYDVHSQNPVGRGNILSYMDQILAHFN